MSYNSSRGSKDTNFSSVRPDPKRYKEDFDNDANSD